MKWRLRNDCRNFILMRCQYPDLWSASDWSWAEGKLHSEALLRSGSDSSPVVFAQRSRQEQGVITPLAPLRKDRERRLGTSQDLGSDTWRRQYEISAVISKRHFAEKPVLASPNFGCFLQVTIEIVVAIKILTIATKEKVSTYTGFHNTRQLGLTTMHRTQFNFKVSKSVG